jgi:hypothetical protein
VYTTVGAGGDVGLGVGLLVGGTVGLALEGLIVGNVGNDVGISVGGFEKRASAVRGSE